MIKNKLHQDVQCVLELGNKLGQYSKVTRYYILQGFSVIGHDPKLN